MSYKQDSNNPSERPKDKQTEQLEEMLNELENEGGSYLQKQSHVVKTPSFLNAETQAQPQIPNVLSANNPAQNQYSQSAQQSDSAWQQGLSAPQGYSPSPAQDQPDEWSQLIASEEPSGEFFHDLGIFLVQLGRAYSKRYEYWEETFSIILQILRKINQTMEQNMEKLIESVQQIFDSLSEGLRLFKKKESEVERYSDIDYSEVTKQFKRTLEMLSFQLRQFRLQQMVDELFEIYISE